MMQQAVLEIPEELVCPLSKCIFVDPVQCWLNGKTKKATYERKSVQTLIDNSAIIGQACGIEIIDTDYDKLGRVEHFKRQYPDHFSTQTTTKPVSDVGSEAQTLVSTELTTYNGSFQISSIGDYFKKFDTGAMVAAKGATHSTIVLKQCVIETPNYVGVGISSVSPSERLPVHLVIGMDESGSMDESVYVMDERGNRVCHGFSKMDLAKQSLAVIIESLSDRDYLTIVEFGVRTAEQSYGRYSGGSSGDTQIRVPLSHRRMDASGKASANTITSGMRPQGETPFYETLIEIVPIIKSSPTTESVHAIILTDGDASDSMLNIIALREVEKLANACTFNTLGFTNAIKSDKLLEVSEKSNGVFTFIPDGTFVITATANTLANIFTTCAINVSALIQFDSGMQKRMNLGCVRFGTIRSGVLALSECDETSRIGYGGYSSSCSRAPNRLLEFGSSTAALSRTCGRIAQVTIAYTDPITRQEKISLVTREKFLNSDNHGSHITDDVLFTHIARQEFSTAVMSLDASRLLEFIDTVHSMLSSKSHLNDEFVKHLMIDATGEATQALSSSYKHTWGSHYARSLGRAHLTQTCNNFKDPGVQHYLSDILKEIISEIDAAVINLPPPIPTKSKYTTAGYSAPTSGHQYSQCYNSSNNPCYLGSCTVNTPEGVVKVQDIKVGDTVISVGGPTKVTHVLKSVVDSETVLMQCDELFLTEWHPVRVNGVWSFPGETEGFSRVQMYVDSVYSFALEEFHVVEINGTETICFGHGIKGDSVVSHEYFGSNKVLDDIEAIDSSRYATITSACIKRDEQSGLICGIGHPM